MNYKYYFYFLAAACSFITQLEAEIMVGNCTGKIVTIGDWTKQSFAIRQTAQNLKPDYKMDVSLNHVADVAWAWLKDNKEVKVKIDLNNLSSHLEYDLTLNEDGTQLIVSQRSN